jgi:hypothetical protein
VQNLNPFVIPSRFTGEESAFARTTADSSRAAALRNDKLDGIGKLPIFARLDRRGRLFTRR